MADAIRTERFLGIPIRPMTRRRIDNFKANRRARWSLWIFAVLFVASLFAEFIANEKPLMVYHGGSLFFPVVERVAETTYGGEFELEADYADPYVKNLIREDGWLLWTAIPYSHDTQVIGLELPAPTPPSAQNILGTDDQARDVAARLIYGFRISVLFGLTLTILSSIIGVAAGAVQGYFGGWVDLGFQRFIEIWGSMPMLYLLIILAAVIEPTFWWLLILLLLFQWMTLVQVVRAEFLRARNFDYVRAARALGASHSLVMAKHVLPNAMVATLTFLPFITSESVVILTALDFLGFGLPPGSASLGEVLKQAKVNLHAPWLGFTAFFTIAVLLSLLIFIGEGARDAFDPRKAVASRPKPGRPADDDAAAPDARPQPAQ